MKILVALDTSPFAERIIQAVTGRNWPRDTQFFLVTVVEQTTGWFSVEDNPEPACQTTLNRAEMLHELAMKLKRRLPGCEVFSDVRSGSPTAQILAAAAECDADLIVVGQQGTANAAGISLGGVAEAVVHRAHCSVEVIKPKVRTFENGAPPLVMQDSCCM